jgi:uncharacterized protein
MRGIWKALCFGALAAILAPALSAQALDVPATPALNAPVVDKTGTLNSEQIETLNQQINNSRAIKDYQFGVLIIQSLEGQALEDYSIKVARAWGIGEQDKSNGVLLLVVMDDRKLRIEVGRGLEGDLTDAESGRIIRNTITPAFKKGDYYSGISLGIQNIAAQVEGRPQADSSTRATQATDENEWIEPVMFLLFLGFGGLSWLAAILARSKSWWAGGIVGGGVGIVIALVAGWVLWSIGLLLVLSLLGLVLDWIVSCNFAQRAANGLKPNWWAGGPWLGGSSGGFSGGGGSFGGGGFSGGGSSGSW